MDAITTSKPARRTVRWTVSPAALRAAHRYCGVLFAPAFLFFAASGVLQVFDLHKPEAWGGATPALVQALANLHKHQTLAVRDAPKAATHAAPARRHRGDQASQSPRLGRRLLQIYAAGASAALVANTLTGLIMTWRDGRRRAGAIAWLAAGVLVPLVFMLLG